MKPDIHPKYRKPEVKCACGNTFRQCPPGPERLGALAARLCYSPASIGDLQEDISSKDVRNLVRRVLSMGHTSVLEHVTFTYGVEGSSRGTSHQLVRHRIASYSQQSPRYVSAAFGDVTPKSLGRRGGAGREISAL